MIAIAESGSTKCEWRILDSTGAEQAVIRTQGFNPYFHSSELVENTLMHDPQFNWFRDQIQQVFFYGAGCSSQHLNQIIHAGLSKVFAQADILVDHDLLACAYTVYTGTPVICCILGTGSNSCYFDGESVREARPALGFILGDEGSGCYFGKQLLTDYFYETLPEEIHHDLFTTFGLTWGEAVKRIYNNVHANVYLASFMPFLAQHKDHPYVAKLLADGIGHFLDTHVMSFPEARDCSIGFVGSLAFVFNDILVQELEKRGLQMGKVIKNPIDELVSYHQKYVIAAE